VHRLDPLAVHPFCDGLHAVRLRASPDRLTSHSVDPQSPQALTKDLRGLPD
jgi:hypothetical protein